jgi:hypothetical protein
MIKQGRQLDEPKSTAAAPLWPSSIPKRMPSWCCTTTPTASSTDMTGSEWALEQAKAQGGRWSAPSTTERPSSPTKQRPQVADVPADSDLEGEGVATIEPAEFDPH